MEGGAGFCFTCAAGAPGGQDVGGLPARCPQEADEQWDTCCLAKPPYWSPRNNVVRAPWWKCAGLQALGPPRCGILVLERINLFCVLTLCGYLTGEEMEAQWGDEDLSSPFVSPP